MATIKISDISVGDWVQDNYGDFVKVAGIWQGCNFNYQVDILRDGKIGTIVPCNLHPIPITAEILEGNGFGKKTFTQDQLFRIVEPNGNMPFIGYRWDSRRVIIERDNDYMLRVKAEYVHQLQHALRLAGVDKEINL